MRTAISRFPHGIGVFALQQRWVPLPPWMIVAVYATTLFATVLPIKIWNSNRNEKKLEQQQLQSQRSAPGRPEPADQSALSVQHAELGRLADPSRPGAGAPGGL